MRKKVVVIGSNSFSGSDFIDLLLDKKRFQVIGVSRSPEKSPVYLPYLRLKISPYQFQQLDINRDQTKLRHLFNSFKPQYIVNFAAQSEVAPSWNHPEHWFNTNVVALAGFTNFLKDAPYLKRFIQISSPEVYGTCNGIVKENAPLNPSTPYAASKAAADLYLLTLFKNFKFPLIIIRSTNVYGPRQQLYKIIPRSIISLKKNRPIFLHGGGKAVKSYIHIRDISRGTLMVMEHGSMGDIYHLSPDTGIAVCNVVKFICQELNMNFQKAIKTTVERPGQDAAYVIDSTKVRKAFGWHPQIDLKRGVKEVVDWIEANWQTIKDLPIEYIHKQ